MRNILNINQIVTRNCGGRGAWLDNPLSSAAPGGDIWPGFQGGGGGGGGSSKRKRRASYKRKHRNSRNNRNNENNRNNRNSKKHNIRKISHRYKKTRRNI
jgi:hypothetical protein